MRILITGGCGFIGLNLIRYIQNTYPDFKIVVVDTLVYDTLKYLPTNVQFHQVDICDFQKMEEVSKGVDAIIHLAANTGVMPSIENPTYDMRVNVMGVVNCLEICRKNNIRKFILASSGAALGDQIPPLHENMVPKPLSPYGASKMCGENYCSAYFGTYGVETVAFRFSNVYGPISWHKNSIVSKFVKTLLDKGTFTVYGNGEQTRDFIYVDDLVRVIMDATLSDIGGEVFQLATGTPTTVNQILKKMSIIGNDLFNINIDITYADSRKGEVIYNHADISKIQKMLAFKPKYNLINGLTKTFEWFKYDNNKNQ